MISVIVPVYKVEKYLDRCVQSIVDQTYPFLEIILVDDGSPDECGDKCDDWAEKDSRIKVVHKKNGGLSDARNAGMRIAKGEYIGFVDSDDWIAPEMYENLLYAIKENNSDIAACGVLMVWEGDNKKQGLTEKCGDFVISGTENIMRELVTKRRLIQTVWNKLYKKEIALSTFFPVGKIYEDEFWSWKIFSESRSIAIIEEQMYMYFQRDGSIMHDQMQYDPYLVLEAKQEKTHFVEQKYPQLQNEFRLDLIQTCIFLSLTVLVKKRKNARKDIDYFERIVKENKIDTEYIKSFGWKRRLRLYTICNCFKLTVYAQYLLKIGIKSNI